MNAEQKSAAIWVGIGAAVLGVLYVVYKSLTDFNKGTPYEGTGAVGTLGNVADQLSGGALSSAGSAIGIALFDLTHSDYANSMNYTFKFSADPSIGGQIEADRVDEDTGIFTYHSSLATSKKFDGKRFKLRRDKDGKKYAEGPL